MQAEEPRGGDEGDRDQEEARVAPAPSGDADRVAEGSVRRRGGEDDPEMRRVVLPAAVDARMLDHQREEAERQCKRDQQGDCRHRRDCP